MSTMTIPVFQLASLCPLGPFIALVRFVEYHYYLSALLALAIIFVSKGLYNSYFHDLSHVPGPFLGGFTDFYKVYIFACRHIPSGTMELHQQFGPLLRLAPNLVSFDDPRMIPEVYHKCVDKTTFYTPAVMGETPSMFWTLKHKEHALKKRLFAPSLSMKYFREHEAIVDERIIKLHQTFRYKFARTGEVFDFAEWARWFLNDTVTHLTFGEPTGCVQAERDVNGLIEALHSMFLMTGLVAALPWLVEPLIKHPLLKRYLLPRPGNGSGSGKIMKNRDQLVFKRLDAPSSEHHDDVLEVLLKTKPLDGGGPVPIQDIQAECLSFMIAASDTTAGLVSPMISNVIERPSVYAELMLEVGNFENAGKLSRPVALYDETEKMPYFKACIAETLRLFPPTPIILPRVVCKGGLTLGDIFLPEGTEIGANPWLTNRNQDIFGEDANIFRPERWLESDEKSREMEKYSFTFGYGGRACIGKNLAHFEAQKLCLQLFRDFHFRSAKPAKPWRSNDRGISIYEDQWMVIQERRPTQGVIPTKTWDTLRT